MRERDRRLIRTELGKRTEWMLRRFGEHTLKVQALGIMPPSMPPGETCTGLRRKIERLRAGKVRGLDPRIPQDTLAELMELTLEREIITRSVVADMKGQLDLERRINERLDSERFRRSVAGFHALKKSPEAADPESPAAQEVRRLNRERRNELGRPKKRRKE